MDCVKINILVLCMSAEREVRNSCPKRTVLYIVADDFTSRLLAALKEQKTEGFYQNYKSADVLLLDDLHTLAGRRQVQEELFLILKELCADGGKVIMAMDVNEETLPVLEEKIQEFFEPAKTVKLGSPDAAARVKILKQFTGGAKLDEPILKFLAEQGPADIRRLKGLLTMLLAYADLLGEEINLELAARVLEEHHCLNHSTVI